MTRSVFTRRRHLPSSLRKIQVFPGDNWDEIVVKFVLRRQQHHLCLHQNRSWTRWSLNEAPEPEFIDIIDEIAHWLSPNALEATMRAEEWRTFIEELEIELTTLLRQSQGSLKAFFS